MAVRGLLQVILAVRMLRLYIGARYPLHAARVYATMEPAIPTVPFHEACCHFGAPATLFTHGRKRAANDILCLRTRRRCQRQRHTQQPALRATRHFCDQILVKANPKNRSPHEYVVQATPKTTTPATARKAPAAARRRPRACLPPTCGAAWCGWTSARRPQPPASRSTGRRRFAWRRCRL